MKLPESFIRLMNPIIHMILASPAHPVFSGSLLVVRVIGRRSGRPIATPLRYEKDGDDVRCFTSLDTLWWRNVQAAGEAELLIRGQWHRCTAEVTARAPDVLRPALVRMLRTFPQDAPYQNIRMVSGEPDPSDLEKAAEKAVLVDFSLTGKG